MATYTGDYQLRNELRGPHALGGGPARQLSVTIAGILVAKPASTLGSSPGTGFRAMRALLVGDTHILDHAGIFGELFPGHDTEFLGRCAAHREA